MFVGQLSCLCVFVCLFLGVFAELFVCVFLCVSLCLCLLGSLRVCVYGHVLFVCKRVGVSFELCVLDSLFVYCLRKSLFGPFINLLFLFVFFFSIHLSLR